MNTPRPDRTPTPQPTSPEAVVRAVRDHLRSRGGAVALLGAACLGGAILLAAWLLAGSGWRSGSPLPLLLWVLGVGLAVAGVHALLRAVAGWTREEALADQAERAAGIAPGLLRAQLELDRDVPAGTSDALVRAGSASLLPRLARDSSELAGRPGQELSRLLRWTALGAGGLSIALVALMVLTPDRTRLAWSGLAQPVSIWTGDVLPPLTLQPGDVSLPRGSTPEVRISAEGRHQVTLHWQAVGDPLREMVLEVGEGMAQGSLPPLDAPVRYWATAPDGARTREARIEPSDPLILGDLRIELRFPEYTRRPVEVLRGAPSELAVPEGTRIVMSGVVADRGARAVLLRRPDGEEAVRLPVENGRFEGAWRPDRSAVVAWELQDGPADASLPGLMDVMVVPDAPPQVAIPVPGTDGELPPGLRLDLLVRATDDHGLAWIEVEAVRERVGGARDAPVTERIAAGGQVTLDLRPVLDVSDWGLRPGEAILLSARAADNSPRVQTTTTPEIRLTVPSAAALRDAGREGIERVADRLDALTDQARDQARELRDMEREARVADERGRGRNAEFQEREELRTAAGQSGRMESELDELRAELEQARRALEGAGDEDGGLRERLRELEHLLSQLTDPDERARMDELMERLATGDRTEAAEELERMAQAREELRDRLQEALDRFRREALEEAFLGTEEEVRAIADAQEAMADRLDSAEGRAAQDSLAARAGEAQDRVQELAERLDAQGDQEAADRARQAAEGLADAQEAMERAAAQSRAGDQSQASDEAQQAAEQAREALEELEQARMEWLEEWKEQIRDVLRRSAEDALGLARRQQEIRARIPGADEGLRMALQSEEAAVIEGARNLVTRIAVSTRQAPEVGREVIGALAEAIEAANATAEGLNRPSGTTGMSAQASSHAIRHLNRAALSALEGVGQVGERSESSSFEDLMEELESLAGDQASANDAAQEAAASAAAGADGADGQRDEAAGAQQEVAQRLEQLSRSAGRGATSDNVEEMAREAREIAEELAGGRLDAETLERQADLLERLLSAGRTLEREGPTEEREGTVAGEVERRAIQPLPRSLLDGNLLPLPGAAQLERLTPAERRLVLEYFERLNRGTRTGGGGTP